MFFYSFIMSVGHQERLFASSHQPTGLVVSPYNELKPVCVREKERMCVRHTFL